MLLPYTLLVIAVLYLMLFISAIIKWKGEVTDVSIIMALVALLAVPYALDTISRG